MIVTEAFLVVMGSGTSTRRYSWASWPTGEFGGMNLEGAVRIRKRRELEAIEDPAAREQAAQAMIAEALERGKAIHVASLLELDAVIDPAKTRSWIVRALQAAPPRREADGRRRVVDAW